MPESPHIADKQPKKLELEPGTYVWCACGRTGNDPWCDGTHRGTEFRPRTIVIKEKGRYALCCCRRSGAAPMCDGTHRTL